MNNQYPIEPPYQVGEIPLPQHNKSYLGLAGTFSSTLGYPLGQVNYISLIQNNGHTLELEVNHDSFTTIKTTADNLHLSQTDNLWLWVSVSSDHQLESWRMFKSDLPVQLIHTLYQYAQHIDALLGLFNLIDQFKQPRIKVFAQSLLYNEPLMKSWLSIGASKQHHHSFPGGLMLHSLEVAEFVKNALNHYQNEISTDEIEITILAALLHDLGKVKTLSTQSHTDLGRLVDHEKLTLLILAEPLSQLNQHWPKGANALQYLLTWNPKEGHCKYQGGELIKHADQFSTKLSLRRMAFNEKPDYFYFSQLKIGERVQYLNRL
ncbi:MAG: hypothetical protein CO158_04790 [Piscirickettsiaceae bacterium CG_4_9_14_3_um_filter_43_564]|nr:HD domain-containing protein [Thiomicrospira sp.]NCN67369.1 HD domain-containing protein [Thiomicrospira sp.]NCO13609.1 HD domain-containing protein [Thiomicrospira sp.]PJA66168.1 MAG: hypothetical protein CO158_04790 [Piscirickettsiaceae bacterium CG_4_9_14_3_um_filter_43_564]